MCKILKVHRIKIYNGHAYRKSCQRQSHHHNLFGSSERVSQEEESYLGLNHIQWVATRSWWLLSLLPCYFHRKSGCVRAVGCAPEDSSM
ncbi:hypothetical protein CEXT_578971 [Caerostris extrusa]|uniref:Uncharacterized protein n=1 Tax=Caerostris extrusa TaxID=172846 RepID=A0AAV4VBN5_CAEEX|nr:hypothetical protein CEXT_578971 [Caerostris extrusa]